MKSALPLVATVAGVVVAQDITGIPSCATNCISSAISAANCATTDLSCQCSSQAEVIGAAPAPCLLTTSPTITGFPTGTGSAGTISPSNTRNGTNSTTVSATLSATGATNTDGSPSMGGAPAGPAALGAGLLLGLLGVVAGL
ncbi:hypothetical protein B0H63DRAFT_516352 [Podospora didyma]|uniref:CFEM domain-containing protein n=1 Tax=Podospora didyma TaxID=330526 RepID=A0AAE0P565_9PEZI|nr:hypothetical protein B0H63DRAFT_530047 [Podospora didyma]KAK3393150.1 hypothetical protein B0H63DRAFT_516352 [Podospora didyma]